MSQRKRVPSATPAQLGDDRERRALHDRLMESMRGLPCPPAASEWSEVGLAQAPPEVSLAVGDAIKLADSLKILSQYARVLESACRRPDTPVGKCLSGLPEACAGTHLDWFGPLLAPLKDVGHLEATYARYLELWARPDGGKTASDEHLAFEVHQAIPHEDVDFTRYLLGLSFPGSREYEVLVAQNILRLNPEGSLGEFRGEFKRWRDRGLLHSLLIGARFMPTLNDWLAVEHHREAAWWGDMLLGVNCARTMAEAEAAVADLGIAFAHGSEAGTQVAGTLDRIGILMGIKSNAAPGNKTELQECLAAWTLGADSPAHEIWAQAKRQLEASLPPSLLCPSLFGAKRGSWGFPSLTLAYEGGRLFIREERLTFVPKPGTKTRPTRNPNVKIELPGGKPTSAKPDPAARIQDVANRMGEILLSPEMGHLMMYAYDGAEYLKTGFDSLKENERLTCSDPHALMAFMDESERYMSPASHIKAFQQALEAGLPKVHKIAYRQPLEVVCWRLDPPGRVVLFTGTAKAAETKAPAELPKKLLDERSVARSVARIRLSGGGKPQEEVNKGLLYYVHRHFRQQTELVKRDGGAPHTHTALAEGMASFLHQKPILHTTVDIHSSVRWDNSHTDARYAETQEAGNGVRYRDWSTVYMDKETTQKVRLESHAVKFQEVHATLFPWRREGNCVQWVHVAATVPPNLLVLHERRAGESADDFRALLASVKSRVLQDLKLLPVRDESHRVERANTSVYGDHTTGQVLVAYAPTGDPENRIEIMAFEMCK